MFLQLRFALVALVIVLTPLVAEASAALIQVADSVAMRLRVAEVMVARLELQVGPQ